MARTALSVSALVAETQNGTYSGLATPAGTAIDQANGMVIAASSLEIETIPPKYATFGLFFRVTNTNGSPRNFIVRAGVNPPAFSKDLGDLTVAIPATTGDVMVGPIDLSRHRQADGSVNVDFGASIAGVITAFVLPRQAAN